MLLVETLKINSNYSCIYNTVVDGTPNVNTQTSGINFADTFHDLKMSASAIKTIKKSCNLILYLSRQRHFQEYLKMKKQRVACTGYRKQTVESKAVNSAYNRYLCTFLTLTLPAKQTHTDIELTKYVLHPFLSYARKIWKVRYFVWKKELQQNGNLHYHLVTDRYIDHDCLRVAWNRCCNRGYVEGVEKPFDYVDRYSDKMIKMFADGWDKEKMFEYYSQSDSVQEATEKEALEFERKNNREISAVEYNQIFYRNANAAYEKGFKRYSNEMKLSENQRWRNPNSTDISAVKNPRQVSAYVAKYIAKNVDESPELITFQEQTRSIKEQIYGCLSDIKRHKLADPPEPYDNELKRIEDLKAYLNQIRQEECPILGKLWFKSETLTPFLKGATDFIQSTGVHSELGQLIDYLKNIETPSHKLVLYSYELNEKGEPDLDKKICTTLLISVFQIMHLADKTGKKRFPLLSQMWRNFVHDCVEINKEKGLYEADSDFNEFSKM